MYPKSLRTVSTRSSVNTSTTTATTSATTEKIEDQEQPLRRIPVKEEGDDKCQSLPAKKTPKRVSFDLIPAYINGDESQRANPSMSTKQGKENIAPFQELLGRRKKSGSPTIKGAGILKNPKPRHHHHTRRRHRLRQNDNGNSNSNNNTPNSYQPRLILRGPREPKYRIVKFKFEGRIIRTVDMEIPMLAR